MRGPGEQEVAQPFSIGRGLLLLLALLCLTANAAQAQGKGHGVEVRAGAELVNADPGSIVSVSFRVTSQQREPVELIETLQLPSGWRALIPAGSFPLAPGEMTVRSLAVQVPQGAAGGKYPVRYAVRSQKDAAVRDEDAVSVVVRSITKVELFLEEKPEIAIAGRECTSRVRVTNRGNAVVNVTLQAIDPRTGSKTRVEPTSLTLAPRENSVVQVVMQTDNRATGTSSESVRLEAKATDGEGNRTGASLHVSVNVMPRVTKHLALDHTLPTTLSLRTSGDNRNGGVQAVWEGAGSLDEMGEQTVDFLFQGPDGRNHGIFGYQDQYRLSYASPELTLRMGDQSFGLSPLTDYYNLGRGVGIDLHGEGRPHLGAYYVTPRGYSRGEGTFGLYVRPELEGLETQVSLLMRRRRSSDLAEYLNDRIWSIKTALRPTTASRVQLEYSESGTTRRGDGHGAAYRAEWNGRLGHSTLYSLRKTHAEPNFRGYYHDVDHTSASLSLPLTERLSSNLSYSTWHNNLASDPTRGAAARERQVQVSARYSLPAKWHLTLGYDQFHRRDALDRSGLSMDEHLARMVIGRSTEGISWEYEMSQGPQDGSAAASRSFVMDHRWRVSLRPGAHQYVAFYGGYRSQSRVGYLLGMGNHLGFSTTWTPTDQLSLTGWYNGYNLWGEGRRSEQGELSLRYRLEDGRSWEMRGQHRRWQGGKADTDYLLVHSIPLAVPTARRTTVGGVRGRIYDAAKPGQPGIADVVLRMGNAAAVTNARGEFVFAGLAPGAYHLAIDRRSVGANRVTDRVVPEVAIKGGEVTRLAVGVVAAANVTGQIVLAPAEKPTITDLGEKGEALALGDPRGTVLKPGGLRGVLVEVTNGEETYRMVTDAEGKFVFDQLRPGNWRVRVYEQNLPAYHKLEAQPPACDLKEGQEQEYLLRVVPQIRRIKMQDEGAVDGDEVLTIRPILTKVSQK